MLNCVMMRAPFSLTQKASEGWEFSPNTERYKVQLMSSVEERINAGVRSKTRSAPQTRTNARSKRSSEKATSAQPSTTREEDCQAFFLNSETHARNTRGHWIKFLVWIKTMGIVLAYGMHQHDDTVLFWVVILVTAGCGFGNAVEGLLKFLSAKELKPFDPSES